MINLSYKQPPLPSQQCFTTPYAYKHTHIYTFFFN